MHYLGDTKNCAQSARNNTQNANFCHVFAFPLQERKGDFFYGGGPFFGSYPCVAPALPLKRNPNTSQALFAMRFGGRGGGWGEGGNMRGEGGET